MVNGEVRVGVSVTHQSYSAGTLQVPTTLRYIFRG